MEGAVSPATATLAWRIKLATILLPTIGFAALTIGQAFPETERVAAGVSARGMLASMRHPLFIILFVLIWLTTPTELGPGQWIGSVITKLTGMPGILVLVYTSGVAFLFRFVGGGLVHKLSPYRLLAIASATAMIGIYGLGVSHSALSLYVSATMYGAGTCFFWPVILSTTSEQFPAAGPAGLAAMAGAGQLATAFVLPLMGHWYDRWGAAATFEYLASFPAFLTLVFVVLYFYQRAKGGYRPVSLESQHPRQSSLFRGNRSLTDE